MIELKRFQYLAYYVYRMDWRTLAHFMNVTRRDKGTGKLRQVARFLRDSIVYNISPLEYYQFGFIDLPEYEKKKWAGTGTMYEFQLQANPPARRNVLNDKRLFHDAYKQFMRHEVFTLEQLRSSPELADRLLSSTDCLVFKPWDGQCGRGVTRKWTREFDGRSLVQWMERNGAGVAETLIKQHAAMDTLSPAGVNTVRVYTLLTREGEYRVLGCRLRISVNTFVDNMAMGNLAAPIDERSGVVNGPAVYSDIARSPETIHPVTGVRIVGFTIPHWNETLELVRRASLLCPQNRSIGWDIAITPDGPDLIEGNHDWCKLVWQLPVGKGLKKMLMEGERYA